MESQTSVSKRAPREFRTWKVQGSPLTLRQPCANPVPTLRQPFANSLPTFSARQPLFKPLFPWAPGTGLETRVNGFLAGIFRLKLCLFGVFNVQFLKNCICISSGNNTEIKRGCKSAICLKNIRRNCTSDGEDLYHIKCAPDQ